MPRTLLVVLLAGLVGPAAAHAQEMSAAERASALARVRTLAECVHRHDARLQRILGLITESEQQRDRAREPAVRRDAERAIEALVAQASSVQSEGRECFGGEALPGVPTDVITRPPPPDPAADAVARAGGTVREVESDARLTDQIRVVRGEQVDGEGQLDPGVVRSAVRAITPRIARCYDSYLERGSLSPHRLNLVFTFRGRGRARAVAVERSDFSDATLERCVRTAGAQLSSSAAPAGGDATFSYALRFGS